MLYKQFVILVALCSAAQPSAAQGRDTAFAVHKLFLQKRQHGEESVAMGTNMVKEANTLHGTIEGLIAGAAPAILGQRKAIRYSARREQEILTAYANGIPLPADVRLLLRRKHFHRTVKDIAGQAP